MTAGYVKYVTQTDRHRYVYNMVTIIVYLKILVHYDYGNIIDIAIMQVYT